jgi:two-component system sensor histidine kinase KdpD
MNSRRILMIVRWIVSFAALAGIVLVYSRWLHVNQTTVALTLVLLILGLAANFSLRYAVAVSLAATAAYNYYFLPPIGSITIADAQNWLALLAFLSTSVIGSRLSQRARDEADQANARQREVELSFQLGRELLQLDDVANLVSSLPMLIARVTRANSVVLFLLDGDRFFEHGLHALSGFEVPHLRQLALTMTNVELSEQGEARVPLKVGVMPRGLVSIQGVTLSLESLETIGGLVSISLDRAQALENVAKGEANRQSERLRTLIIDSITHELRTPLTSIKGAASALLANADTPAEARTELLQIINEESDRLNLLVSQATEMAQLDAQQVHMTFQRVSVQEMLDSAGSTCLVDPSKHPLTLSSVPDLPRVAADPEFVQKVLCNLLENAEKYSPEGSPIFLSARLMGRFVEVSVADRGVGIDSSELALIFDRFYRGRSQGDRVAGTGMGLAISKAIISAHGGTLSVTSQLGQGSVFTFTLPIDSDR